MLVDANIINNIQDYEIEKKSLNCTYSFLPGHCGTVGIVFKVYNRKRKKRLHDIMYRLRTYLLSLNYIYYYYYDYT